LKTILAWPALSLRGTALLLATLVVLVELAFRRFAPKSNAYRHWSAFFEAVGSVWTAVLLSLVYVVSVGTTGLVMRLFGRDPLDRALVPEPTFWRPYQANPMGARAAVRHQF
jgi:hypothetical protein